MVVQPVTAVVPAGGEAALTVYVVCVDSSMEPPDDGATYAPGSMPSGDLLKLAQCACRENLAGSLNPFEGMGVMIAGWMISEGRSFAGCRPRTAKGRRVGRAVRRRARRRPGCSRSLRHRRRAGLTAAASRCHRQFGRGARRGGGNSVERRASQRLQPQPGDAAPHIARSRSPQAASLQSRSPAGLRLPPPRRRPRCETLCVSSCSHAFLPTPSPPLHQSFTARG